MKNIFIICTVRTATPEYRKRLENYVFDLESKGFQVHLPHRDTNQTQTGFEICSENKEAIIKADEVHIFYNPNSLGTHFDMGVSFALDKKIVVVENLSYDQGTSMLHVLMEWEKL